METDSEAEEEDETMEEVPTKVRHPKLISMNKLYTLIDSLVKDIPVDHASKKYKDFKIAFTNWSTKSNKAASAKNCLESKTL